jgi:SAM-dependent methyltransferase
MIDNLGADTCILCGGSDISVDGLPEISPQAREFIRPKYQIVKCNDCRFYFVHPPISLSRDEWQTLYGDTYFGEMPAWWTKKRQRDRKERLGRLDKYSQIPIRNFLDIGCGEGFVLIDAQKKGWNPLGIDIADNRVGAAKEISFIKGDLQQAAFADNYFDCIYLDSVLEHILEPISFLNEVNRVLKPGGVLYIGVPNEECLFNDVRKLIFGAIGKTGVSVRALPFKSPYHVNGFTKHSLKIALKRCEFEILQLRDFAGLYEWRKFAPFSRPFLMHLMMLPVQIAAIPLNKRIYIDAIVMKRG